MNVEALQAKLRLFAQERDWEQFHSPKNLAMALAGEAGELLELFQWLTEEKSRALRESPADRGRVAEEIADIAIYVLRLCDQLGIDLEPAIEAKMRANALKYPIHLARGTATKYTELQPKPAASRPN